MMLSCGEVMIASHAMPGQRYSTNEYNYIHHLRQLSWVTNYRGKLLHWLGQTENLVKHRL